MDRLRNSETEPADATLDILYEEFDLFLTHGGFLPAINDLAKYQRILPATFSTYSDWIRGDVLKRAKNEHYLREVLGGILKRYGSQVTWNALAQDLSIDHPKTVADYIALLVSMDAVYVQSALMEDKLTAAPKKARKVMFTDPFIYHALAAWLKPGTDPFVQQVRPTVADPVLSARLAEACVVTHYRRFYPTYYIKADGEVDVAYIDRDRFHPLEVKWTRQSRAKDLKQIARYPGGRILTKARQRTSLSGVPTEPLPLALLRLPLPYA
jgi:predicted AAA+ superfamily ATPase